MNTVRNAVNRKPPAEVDGVWRRVQFALLPPHCLLCGCRGQRLRDLCERCAADLQGNHSACARCALPLAIAAPRCGECLRNEPAFDATWAPYLYAHPLDVLLMRLKFGRSLAAGRVLAECWIAALREANFSAWPEAIVPMPLHATRLRERGFNQTLELAKPIARALGLPLAPAWLRRIRATALQSHLDANARRSNLRGAFVADGEAMRRCGMPAHLVLLDDVMTTGTTVREAAGALKRAGVPRVDVWTLARAPHRQ